MRWFSFLLSLSVGISVVVERDAEVNRLGRLECWIVPGLRVAKDNAAELDVSVDDWAPAVCRRRDNPFINSRRGSALWKALSHR